MLSVFYGLPLFPVWQLRSSYLYFRNVNVYWGPCSIHQMNDEFTATSYTALILIMFYQLHTACYIFITNYILLISYYTLAYYSCRTYGMSRAQSGNLYIC